MIERTVDATVLEEDLEEENERKWFCQTNASANAFLSDDGDGK